MPKPGWLYQYSDKVWDYYETAPKHRLKTAREYVRRTREEWAALEEEDEGMEEEDEDWEEEDAGSEEDRDRVLDRYQDQLLKSSSHLLMNPSSKAYFLSEDERERIAHGKQKQASVYHRSAKHPLFSDADKETLKDLTVKIDTTNKTGQGAEAHQGLYPNTFTYLNHLYASKPDLDVEEVSEKEEESGGTGDLYDETLAYKLSMCEQVASQVGKLTFLTAGVYNAYPLVMVHIDLDKVIASHKRKGKIQKPTEATKKAFTSFLMSYYLGLANYLARSFGFDITMVERSSFGFVTPSVAETAESFRLNLGLMPAGYANVHIRALYMLDRHILDVVKNGVGADALKKMSPELQNYYEGYERKKQGGVLKRKRNVVGDLASRQANLANLKKRLAIKKKNLLGVSDWFEFALFRAEVGGKTSVQNLARKRKNLDAVNAMAFNLMAEHGGNVSGLGHVLSQAFIGMKVEGESLTTVLEGSSYAYKVAASQEDHFVDKGLEAQHEEVLALFRENIGILLTGLKEIDRDLYSSLYHVAMQLVPHNPHLEEALDILNELLLIASQKQLETERLSEGVLAGGYGSESEVEEDSDVEMEEGESPKLLVGKKIVVHNGMRALLASARAAKNVIFKSEKEIWVDIQNTYYELGTALADSNMGVKAPKSGRGRSKPPKSPHILLRDINACVTSSPGKYASDQITGEIESSRAKVWIIDTTSAKQSQMAALVAYFKQSKAQALFLVSSGFKQEQLGSDRNPYGTARIFAERVDSIMVDQLLGSIKSTDQPLAPSSHLYRRLLKSIGAVPRNESILKSGKSVLEPGKKGPSKISWSKLIGDPRWLLGYQRSPQEEAVQQLLQTFKGQLEQVSAQDSEHDERADHSQHARAFIGVAPSVKASSRVTPSWLDRRPNAGGGDCLLYALEGRDLNFEGVMALRNQIAASMGQTLPQQVSGNSIYMALYQSGYMDQAMEARLEGRHQVPRAVYQSLARIPGMYAGEDEIRAWMRYRGVNEVFIITDLGEVRRVRANGAARIMQLDATNLGDFERQVAALVQQQAVVLYKTPNHWERVTGQQIPQERM